jgi:hypothetical protein
MPKRRRPKKSVPELRVPAFIFLTAIFESQEPMITREVTDLLNKVLSLSFGISGPFFWAVMT